MAITLKDQATQKKPFKLNQITKFLILTLEVLVIASGSLFLYQKVLGAFIESTQDEIRKIDQKRDAALEGEMKQTIANFQRAKALLNNHKNAKGVFTFLEENTYEGVTLSNFEANIKENALSFNIASAVPQNLAIQIAAFKRAEWGEEQKRAAVTEVNVGGFSISEGSVRLHLKLQLNPEITKF